MPKQSQFQQTLTDAVADFTKNGYDSEQRLEEWVRRLRAAAEAEVIPEYEAAAQIRAVLGDIYQRLVDRGGLLKHHPKVGRFTLERVKPKLRQELDRRILASTNLIKLNREQAVENTLHRFSGWATSIPIGGTKAADRTEVKASVKSRLTSMPYVWRRLHIDQGHKLLANLNEILALDGNAIAMRWRQHYTRNPRETHKARDGKVYAIRDNWALERGLMKAGPAGYTDEITKPAEEVFCRCTGTYLHSLRQLPPEMITQKGRDELERVRKELAA